MDASILPKEYVEKTIKGMDPEYKTTNRFPIIGEPGKITILTLSEGSGG